MKIKKNKKIFFVDNPDAPGFKDFWVLLDNGLWELGIFQVFDEFLDKEHSYIDIGAWVGPTVLYGCQLAKHCYAIEPDPVAFKILQENIDLNQNLASNITLYKGCIADRSGMSKLGSNTQFGNALSSLLTNKSSIFLDVQSLTFEDFIKKNNINDCNFIKMDIEGGEIRVLPTMRKYLQEKMPTLFLSLHPFWFEDKEKDCKAIINVLSIYPSIYREDGKKIGLDELFTILMSLQGENYSVIATLNWDYNKRLFHFYRYKIRKFSNRGKYYLFHPFKLLRAVISKFSEVIKKQTILKK
ncbi:MAG: FkbM family methyltransferase [Candidatus Omnitrophica bacterium]|nr:FkbM family methyltransferase [Candidatus Omnitrophota bacterium]